MIYDVAIIGSGPAALFAAMEIVTKTNKKVLILEKAKRLNDSRNVSLGWLGGCARSSVKLFLDKDFGGHILNEELRDYFLSKIEEYSSFKMKIIKKKLPRKSIKSANEVGINIEEPETGLMPEDKMIKLGDFLYDYLKRNATVLHKIDITNIHKTNDLYVIDSNEGTFVTKKCVLGLGRGGAEWLFKHNDLQPEYYQDHYYFGVRLEFPSYTFKEFADRSCSFRFKFDEFKSTVPNFMGTIETEEIGNLRVSNGRTWGSNKSSTVNLGLSKRFESINSHNDLYRLTEIVNVMSDNQLLRESYSRIMSGETMLNHIPEFMEVMSGVTKLGELFPAIKKKSLIFGPESRLNSICFKLSPTMETTIDGLYIVGDMSGHTSSFVQAACSGIVAGNSLI